MLDWLTGNGRNSQLVSAGKDAGEVAEPPQTPAPVFAVRAFKTALFGTPQEVPEKNAVVKPQDEQNIAGQSNSRPVKLDSNGATTTNRLPLGRTDANANRPVIGEENGLASPSKPPGIMLTPGIGPSRRKTVSFGASVLDNEGKRSFRARKIEVKDESATTSSQLRKSNLGTTTTESGRTRLTEILTELRDQIHDEDDGEKGVKKSAKVPAEPGAEDHDITIDMDKPRSTSGRYWMSEFESYQEEAQHVIKKLKKYRDMAKAYSREKDLKITSLEAKLHDESQKVKMLEAEISDLIAILTSLRSGNDGSQSEHSRLAEMLASQTRLALEYRREVDRLQAALVEDGFPTLVENVLETTHGTSPRTAETLLQTRQELKKARKQVQEITELRVEMSEFKSKVREAEQRAKKFEEDNISLTEELARTKGKLKEMEKQRKVEDDNRRNSTYKEEEDRIYVSQSTGGKEKVGHKTFNIGLAMSSGEGTATSKPYTVTRSLRGVNLPPERAAAAMARLEQRKVERKRLRMQERKEEIART